MDNLAAMTAEQLQQLLRGLRDTQPAAAATMINHPIGNFSTCQSRYSGQKRESVEAFINVITTFKDCVNMSEANARKGLPLLINSTAATWNDALISLKRA